MKPLVSKKLRQSAQGQACTMRSEYCNEHESDVVLCHMPLPGMAGTGQKVHDTQSFYGCKGCHHWFDVIARGDESRWREGFRAHAETQSIMLEQGLLTAK